MRNRKGHLRHIIYQIEYGWKFFVGSCMSCYLTEEEQNRSIKQAEEIKAVSDYLETYLKNQFKIYNAGNCIEPNWVYQEDPEEKML